MAAPSATTRPSGPWALLWLGGGAAAVWLPLLLADCFPSASIATAPSALVPPAAQPSVAALVQPQPRMASLASAPAPRVPRPSPRLDSRRGAASPIASLPALRVKTAKPKARATTKTQAKPQAVVATPKLAPATAHQHPLPGSLLLGGPLTLASLDEKPMVPAARIEHALQARSADRLAALPLHWRPTMAALIQGQNQVLSAEVVHLPAAHLQTAEEYPMAVQSDGVVETPVTPSVPSRQALQRWAEHQSPTPQGSVRPVLVVLEPLAAEPRPNGRSANQ